MQNAPGQTVSDDPTTASQPLLAAFQRAALINATLLKLCLPHDDNAPAQGVRTVIDDAIRILESASLPAHVRAAETLLATIVRDYIERHIREKDAREAELRGAVETLSDALIQLHETDAAFAEQVLDRSERLQQMVSQGHAGELRELLNSELEALRRATTAKREAEARELAALRARVSALEERMQVLAQQARLDPLTGLFNRRAWEEQLRELEQGGDESRFAVAILDLDGFKHLNDTEGHAAGDAALAAFGAYCRQAFGDEDFAARIGGDEFGVLIAAPSPEHATQHVRRLLDCVRRANATPGYSGHATFTLSVGLAAPRRDESLRERIRRADEALYAAKRAGRNRLVVAA